MKKVVLYIFLIVILILIVVLVKISDNRLKNSEIVAFNSEFEVYKDKSLYGADILSIINKAIDNNESHSVQKDSKGDYIEDDTYSVKVIITLLTKDEKEEIQEKTYQMEVLQRAGLDEFITNFSLTEFECTDIKYNDLGRVSEIMIKQLEI